MSSLNFMFCWPLISIYACNEINLMHYSSPVYSVTIPLHRSGLLVAHHQEVTVYRIYATIGTCCAFCFELTRPADSQLKRTRSICCIYILLPPDDGKLGSPKYVELKWLNKLKINIASSWFITRLPWNRLTTQANRTGYHCWLPK
jgi:hypothetical protein